MTDIDKKAIFKPEIRIETLRQFLAFGIALSEALKRGEIDISTLNKGIVYKGVEISPKWETANINDHAGNLELTVMGISFLTMDEVLDEVFDKKPEIFSESDIDALRAIVYMLRCALAHGFMIPKWRVDSEKFKRKFRIDELDFEIDATDLDGKLLNSGHYGGIKNIFRLISYAKKVIKNHYIEE